MTVWKWITNCFRSKLTTPPALPAEFQWTQVGITDPPYNTNPYNTLPVGSHASTVLEMPCEHFATSLPSTEGLDIVEASAPVPMMVPAKAKKKAKSRKRK